MGRRGKKKGEEKGGDSTAIVHAEVIIWCLLLFEYLVAVAVAVKNIVMSPESAEGG